jgi:hypothetical protein
MHMLCGLSHQFGVAGEARIIGLGFILKALAAAGGVALDAVELAGFGAGAHEPSGVGIVFSQSRPSG